MRPFLAALASLLLLALAPDEQADTTLSVSPALLVLPLELRQFALEQSCDLTYDHYGNGANFAPPYMYDVLPGLPGRSAVFWCRRKEDSFISMELILVKFDEIHEYRAGKYLPRKGQVLSTLNLGQMETACGLGDWSDGFGGQKYPRLSGFRKWASGESVNSHGRTIVSPIVGLAIDGSCPVFYYYEGEWLWFVPD